MPVLILRDRKRERRDVVRRIFIFTKLCFLLASLLVVFAAVPAQANSKYASIVMDADTGMILHQRYADKRVHPASLTKVMTLLMLFDKIERGELTLNSRIRISHHAAGMVPSKLGLPAGSTIRVKDAIYALVTKSANDVAAAIAENIGGTESNFANMMTKRAREIGMRSTRFKNASGLHNKYQVTTARDMAKMARYVIEHYPGYYRYFSTQNFSYRGKSYRNHNGLMKTYRGMDGMKTGYINASGFNLIASAVRNDRRIIGVVFGGRTSRSRNAHMAQLLDQGFSKMGRIYVAKASKPIPKQKPGVASQVARLEALKVVEPASGAAVAAGVKVASLVLPKRKPAGFEEHASQGDSAPYDETSARILAGMSAVNAHKESKNIVVASYAPPSKAKLPPPSFSEQTHYKDSWSIQVGAYSNRDLGNRAIAKAKSFLPDGFKGGVSVIAPLRTDKGYLYRARLAGYSKSEAYKACSYFKDCIAIAP